MPVTEQSETSAAPLQPDSGCVQSRLPALDPATFILSFLLTMTLRYMIVQALASVILLWQSKMTVKIQSLKVMALAV